MKTNRSIFLTCLALAVLFFSCSSDDDDNNNSQNTAQEIMQIEDRVESGTWRITSFIDSGQNETSDYNGYDFTFNGDGTLVASDGNMTINGTWSVTDDSDDDDSTDDNDIDFNISFAAPEDFQELTDDWDVVSHTSTRIELIDISGGNGDVENLVFEKN